MTLEELNLISTETFTKFRSDISDTDKDAKIEKAKKQYKPTEHDIIIDSENKRRDKTIKVQNENGETESRIVKRTKISIPMQKQIVRRAVAFLMGNPIGLHSDAQDNTVEAKLLEVVKRTWEDTKLDYKLKEVARLQKSEGEAAILLYTTPVDPDHWKGTANEGIAKFETRLMILANSKGDKLFPIFDNRRRMIAFGREWVQQVAGKEEVYFDLYTDDKIRHFVTKANKTEDKTEELPAEINLFKKIPISYFNQDDVEWADVQTSIDRVEEILSDYADMIKYFGSPMIKMRGTGISLPNKGEPGKAVQVMGTKDEADIDFMTWDAKPEAVIFEYETEMEQIHTQTSTPDISFSSMASVDNGSGIKLKLMFMDAVLKAMESWETFGEGVQRLINLLKISNSVINVSLESGRYMPIVPIWTPYMPMNDLEEVEKIAKAVEGGFVSRKTAVAKNPMVDDAVEEMENIEEEAKIIAPAQLDLVA